MTTSLSQARTAPPVLVGFAESLAAIESAWLLRDAGYEVHAFTRSGSRPALARSPGIHIHPVTSPQHDSRACAEDVRRLAAAVGAIAILPLDDDAVWLTDVARDGGMATPVAGPTGSQAEFALDKRLQLAAAKVAGFAVPPTVHSDGAATDLTPPDSASGWVVKPALAVEEHEGALRRPRASTATTLAELRAAIGRASWPVLVQPLLTGVGRGVFGFATEGGVSAFSGHLRVRMMNPAGSGASACAPLEVDPASRGATERMVVATGWAGLFMVELLSGDGATWFMELNGRPWGSMALAARRGLPYPLWAVQAAQGMAPVLGEGDDLDVLCRHAGRELVHLAFVARSAVSDRGRSTLTLTRAVRDVLQWRSGHRLYNYRPGEGRTFRADTWDTVRSHIPTVSRR